MKILQVITGLQSGGSENMLLNSLPKFNKNFEMLVVSINSEGAIAKELRKKKIKVICLNCDKLTSFSKALSKLIKIIEDFKPDLIHSHLFHANIISRIAGNKTNIPVVCSQRNLGDWRSWWHNWLDKLTSKWCKKIICSSNAIKNSVQKKTGISKDKFIVIHNGIDIQKYIKAKKAKLNIAKKFLVIGCVANLRKEKGHKYLIKAAKKVVDKIPNCIFLLVGDGKLRKDLEKQIEELNLKKNILFLGSRKDIPNLMKAMDVFVLPSISEGFGIVLVEAMASGVPVVATKVGGIPEIVVENKTGYLVNPKDSSNLTNKMTELLKSSSLRKRFSSTGIKRAKNKFTIQRYVNEHEKIYKSLIEK